MAKLTKTAAYETAKIMAGNAIDSKIEKLKDERTEIITEYARKATKPEVLALYDGNIDIQPYFKTKSYFKYACDELHEDYNSYNTSREFPRSNLNSEYIQVSRADYDRLDQIGSSISSLYEKRDQLRNKIEATLLALGTFKRIETEFPEAFQHIPKKFTEPVSVQTPALPIEDLKAELLQYQ